MTSRNTTLSLHLRRGALAAVLAAVSGCGSDPAPSFAWQTVLSDLPGATLSVWGTSSRDVYVVGADAGDGSGAIALHFDGRAWARIDTTLRGGTLWWVQGVAPDAVYMVGSGGTVLRYNPTTGVAERQRTPGTATLFGVWGSSASDVWAVGGDTAAQTGALWHWNGSAWMDTALPNNLGTQVILYKVWGASARDVWAVGSNGTTIHYDGQAWSQVMIPTTARGPLFTVHGAGAQRYAVGGNASGILLEGQGTAWRQVELLDAPRLAGVYAPASGAPLAVGNEGSVYSRHGGAWKLVARPPQTDLDFHAVWIEPDTGAVWAVGGQVQSTPLVDGLVMRFSTGAQLPTTYTTPMALTTCPMQTGTICTWAGSGVQGFNGDGHTLRETALYWPMDMTFAPDGRAYVIDWNNHRIRRPTPNGTFETLIGTDLPGDGPPGNGDLMEPGVLGTTVALNHPTQLLFQPDGRMLVVAWHNHKLRRFDPATNQVFVTVGRGPGATGDGGPAAMALLKQPSHIARDRDGNLYVLDQGNGRIRRIDGMTGIITTIAGSPPPMDMPMAPFMAQRGYAGDGGPAARAVFNWQSGENPEPEGGLVVGPDNKLYISDTGNHRIRRIDLATMTIESFAGDGMFRFAGDGGPAAMASLYAPQDLEFGPDGLLYVADSLNHRVRAIDLTTGVIRTIAGNGTHGYSGDRGPATEAQLWRPFGLAFDRDGVLYISDTLNNRIRRMTVR